MKKINYTYNVLNVHEKLYAIKPYIKNFGFEGAVLWITVTNKNYRKVMILLS